MLDLPQIETVPNPSPQRRYEVEFSCPEWTAVCPRSGFPDFATMHIIYEPKELIVELKSLKLYLNAYRNVGIFHEAAVNQILEDIVASCQPWSLRIEGDFNVRGNIKTKVRASYRSKNYDQFLEP